MDDIYERLKDFHFDDWDNKKNWKCVRCKIKFDNMNHWIFHRKVGCPNMTGSEKRLVAPDGRYEDTKKNRQCYRCGRYGHYYRKGECYAFRDDDGKVITWGERSIPKRKNPPKKTWDTSPGSIWSRNFLPVHYPTNMNSKNNLPVKYCDLYDIYHK